MAVRKKSTSRRSEPSKAPVSSAPRSRSRKQTSRSPRTISAPKSAGFTVDGLIKDFTPVLGVVAGFALASFLDKKFTSPTATAVAGLAGLDGTDANKFVKPIFEVGVGYAIKHFVKHEFAQSASLGIMAYGGINLASAVIGKPITLSGIEDEAPQVRGIGSDQSDLDKVLAEALKANPPVNTATPVKGVDETVTPTMKGIGAVDDGTQTYFPVISGAEDLNGAEDLSGYEDVNGVEGIGEIGELDPTYN